MAQVIPFPVLLTMGRAFSAARKHAMERCWLWEDKLFDQESLLKFTRSSAPSFTKVRQSAGKVSSKQMGVAKEMFFTLKRVSFFPLAQ